MVPRQDVVHLIKKMGTTCSNNGACYEGKCGSLKVACEALNDRYGKGTEWIVCSSQAQRNKQAGVDYCNTLWCTTTTSSSNTCTSFNSESNKNVPVMNGVPCETGSICMNEVCKKF